MFLPFFPKWNLILMTQYTVPWVGQFIFRFLPVSCFLTKTSFFAVSFYVTLKLILFFSFSYVHQTCIIYQTEGLKRKKVCFWTDGTFYLLLKQAKEIYIKIKVASNHAHFHKLVTGCTHSHVPSNMHPSTGRPVNLLVLLVCPIFMKYLLHSVFSFCKQYS